MDELLNQIEKSLEHEMYFISLMGALAIPDIYGALGAADGKASGSKYKDWFNNNLANYGYMSQTVKFSGDDCYYFRCSLLHQGTTQHTNSTYSRIMFVEPGGSVQLHLCNLSGVLVIDVVTFVKNIVEAARKWFELYKSDALVLANMDKFIRRHPNGFGRTIVGTPVYT